MSEYEVKWDQTKFDWNPYKLFGRYVTTDEHYNFKLRNEIENNNGDITTIHELKQDDLEFKHQTWSTLQELNLNWLNSAKIFMSQKGWIDGSIVKEAGGAIEYVWLPYSVYSFFNAKVNEVEMRNQFLLDVNQELIAEVSEIRNYSDSQKNMLTQLTGKHIDQ